MDKKQSPEDYKWSQLSEDDKDYYQVLYIDPNTREVIKNCLIKNFGEHNLQPKPKIKTWNDFLEEVHKDSNWSHRDEFYDLPMYDMDDKIKAKIIAAGRIAKLIELGYGGSVTAKEWKENGAWQIIPYRENYDEKFKLKIVMDFQHKSFISFHEEEQAKEFMSYHENNKLAQQYYMLI